MIKAKTKRINILRRYFIRRVDYFNLQLAKRI